MSEFRDSIAQNNVNFPIETVIEPLAGENYSKVMIFVPLSQAETYLPGVSGAQAKTLTVLNSSNYGVITGGKLKTWLTPFFKNAQVGVVGIAIYDDGEEATNTLAVVYETFKMYAYFKLGLAPADAYNDLQVALSTLCGPDELYSAHLVGTSDTNALAGTSTLMTALTAAGSNARVIYNPDDTINGALAQLGRSLSVVNITGTPVGNDVDMVAFSGIEASGALEDGERKNLTATQKAALDNQNIGYQTWVGDGTENVDTEGSLTLKGESAGANWVKHFITYMCKVRTANYISQMNKFRNNNTYQGIILILNDVVSNFVKMGRLAKYAVTAPVFDDLPKTGDTIVVPHAWEAEYIDSVREVTVFGTLFITQPTR